MKTWQKISHQPQLKHKLSERAKILAKTREFFADLRFLEVDTPQLVQFPGTEPYLEVFETKLTLADGRSKRGFLTTSPELSMKKLLSVGIGNCYQICKAFRNEEGLGDKHNHEFTILEFYRVGADYNRLMCDCESLINHIHPENKLEYQGKSFDLRPPFIRLSVAEAFWEYAQINTEELLDEVQLPRIVEKRGLGKDLNWEEAYNLVFLNIVDPKLAEFNQPVFLYDYPISQAALSRPKQSDPRFAERFEWYLAGIELGNAFSELTDSNVQKERMQTDLVERKKLGKVEFGLDQNFIDSLEQMPPTAGIAVGLDRLIMLLTDSYTIKQVNPFPVAEVFDLE